MFSLKLCNSTMYSYLYLTEHFSVNLAFKLQSQTCSSLQISVDDRGMFIGCQCWPLGLIVRIPRNGKKLRKQQIQENQSRAASFASKYVRCVVGFHVVCTISAFSFLHSFYCSWTARGRICSEQTIYSFSSLKHTTTRLIDSFQNQRRLQLGNLLLTVLLVAHCTSAAYRAN